MTMLATQSANFTAVNQEILFLNDIAPGLTQRRRTRAPLKGLLFHVTGTFVGSVILEASLDGTNWVSWAVYKVDAATAALGAATGVVSAVGVYAAGGLGKFDRVRLRCSAYTSGTIVVAVAAADDGDFAELGLGVQVTKPFSTPDLDWAYAAAAAITTTADVALKAAAGAGLRNYITGLQIKNTHATVATEVVLKDGATVIWRGHLSAVMVYNDIIPFQTPLKTSANAALNFACITTGANVYVGAQGYVAP